VKVVVDNGIIVCYSNSVGGNKIAGGGVIARGKGW
jgi:hypothetical protein